MGINADFPVDLPPGHPRRPSSKHMRSSGRRLRFTGCWAQDSGAPEEYIGKFISHRREEFVLATKCGCHWVDRGDHYDVEHIWTPDQLRHNLETSLQRMKTDYVDIWQL